MSAAECPLCAGEGSKDGCEVCERFPAGHETAEDRQVREGLEARLADASLRFNALKAAQSPAPSSTTPAALSEAEGRLHPLWRELAEKRIESGVDWPSIVRQLFRTIDRLAARALVSEPDGLAEQRDYAAFVGAEAELARLRSAIERLHGSPHWCNDNEGQPDVFEEGVLWPCPTIALLAAPDDAEVDRGAAYAPIYAAQKVHEHEQRVADEEAGQ